MWIASAPLAGPVRASYYLDRRTLAEIGRMLGEHEATVSRHLAKLRRQLRFEVEEELRMSGMTAAEAAECLASVAEDPGAIDLGRILGAQEGPATIVQGSKGAS
jgi:hypothetical protein